jgi:hypothetical protein
MKTDRIEDSFHVQVMSYENEIMSDLVCTSLRTHWLVANMAVTSPAMLVALVT